MGTDFRKAIAEVYDRWNVEIGKKPRQPIIFNLDDTFGHVERTVPIRFTHTPTRGRLCT